LLWFFCFFPPVKLRPLKRVPLLITATAVGLTILLRCINPDFVDRIERVTYDMRARGALRFSPPVCTNFGFVCIDEETIRAVARGDFGYRYGLYWPRQVYGRAVEELRAEGAKAIAFDVVFGELRHDHPMAEMPDGELVESDDYLARQMHQAGNVILAVTPEIRVPELFRTNAATLADITADKDLDGILRRVRAFRDYVHWHPVFLQAAADPELGVKLDQARVEPGRVILPCADGSEVPINLDAEGRFELADFVGDDLPAGWEAKARAFTTERIWHMGVVLAARELGLDLDRAEVDLARGRIVLHGPQGLKRVIPVDHDGYFLIDWCITPSDPRLTIEPFQAFLARNHARAAGQPVTNNDLWRGKLAIIGSAVAGGNDLTDRGATPLESSTLLVSKHWNVANSIIEDRFVRRLTFGQEAVLTLLLGLLSGLVTWRLRALSSAAAVVCLFGAFALVCFGVYVHYRIWVPFVLPSCGAILVNWSSLTAWRVVFEQMERRRVKSVFSKIVSPNVVNELLQAETLSLGGARREVSVFFADVRGFTAFTDASHEQATEHIRARGLEGPAAKEYVDQLAHEALDTVNLYLARVADMVKRHDGTLDKYIGDCVMAFWGAPTPNPRHASACVRAAIDAQRAVEMLNQERMAENRRIDEENARAASTGLPIRPLLPLLALGTGINSGPVTVGLMGSDSHILNYTVFGREVNVASRLEGVSGRGRIIISEATFMRLQHDDPSLAAVCVALPPVDVKGIREAVRIYQVAWQT